MALAKKCDRCSCFYIQQDMELNGVKVNGFMLINRDRDNRTYSSRDFVDLCPTCLSSFRRWLLKGEKE